MTGTLGPGIGYGRASRFMYVATAGQVTFTGADSSAQALTMSYTPGYVEVAVNGVWIPPQDYVATNGSSVVLNSGCVAGDIVYAWALSTFSVLMNAAMVPGSLWGLTMSTAGASTTLSVAKGSAADSTNAALMTLTSAMAKTTSVWAAGTAAGGLDTGAIANTTWYHWFLIMNPTTLAVDVVFSATTTPANGPTTMPSGFTLFRRIGAMRTNGSAQWVKFLQFNDEFLWDADDAGGTACFNGAVGTTASTATTTVPTNVKVTALTRVQVTAPGASITNILISSFDQSDQSTAAVLSLSTPAISGAPSAGHFAIRTNTSGQIRLRSNTAATTIYVTTMGWIDDRGKLS